MRDEPCDIFVVDDDRYLRDELTILLRQADYHVSSHETISSCKSELARRVPLLILLDIQLPDGNGVDFLKELMNRDNPPEVVMVSGAASLQEAADSVKLGAADFLEKPFAPQRLLSIVRNCIEIARLKQAHARLIRDRLAEFEIIGESAATVETIEQIRQIADTNARVLITGESGTGKELVAGQIHLRSKRALGPFVKINCSAMPPDLVESELFGHERGAFTGAVDKRQGKFAAADGGSLLLDEIGDMPIAAQPKLLRTLETGVIEPIGSTDAISVDVRLISSSNRDLDELSGRGEFRSDLLYRINTVPIHLSPLRDRREDIPILAEHFLTRLASQDLDTRAEFDDGVIELLIAHNWPGNVRELRNLIERAFYTSTDRRITPEHNRICLGEKGDITKPDIEAGNRNRLSAAVTQFEKGFLRSELRAVDGNINQLAGKLRMDRGNLYRKLKKLGLL